MHRAAVQELDFFNISEGPLATVIDKDMQILITGATRGIGAALIKALAGTSAAGGEAHTIYLGCRDMTAGEHRTLIR